MALKGRIVDPFALVVAVLMQFVSLEVVQEFLPLGFEFLGYNRQVMADFISVFGRLVVGLPQVASPPGLTPKGLDLEIPRDARWPRPLPSSWIFGRTLIVLLVPLVVLFEILCFDWRDVGCLVVGLLAHDKRARLNLVMST